MPPHVKALILNSAAFLLVVAAGYPLLFTLHLTSSGVEYRAFSLLASLYGVLSPIVIASLVARRYSPDQSKGVTACVALSVIVNVVGFVIAFGMVLAVALGAAGAGVP
jgi:hypothetical protein